MMTSGAQRLRELERTAKQERKGMWVTYVPPPTNQVRAMATLCGAHAPHPHVSTLRPFSKCAHWWHLMLIARY